MPKINKTNYAYIILDEPQLCVWGTEKEAERERAKVGGTRTSDVFAIPGCDGQPDWYSIIEDALITYSNL